MPKVYIPEEFAHKRSLVAIPKKDYEALLVFQRQHSVKSIRKHRARLSTAQQEEYEVLAIVKRAEADYRAGRTRTIQSLRELR